MQSMNTENDLPTHKKRFQSLENAVSTLFPILFFFVLLLTVTTGFAATLYVSPSGSPANDGSSWAQSISDINVAGALAGSNDLIMVSNGVYVSAGSYGEEANNVLTITTGVQVRSVNGYSVTTISGGSSNRCVYMPGSNTVLDGFTLSDGVATAGGGVYADGYASITNCRVVGCQATNSGGGGIKMYASFLDNSLIESNASYYSGGGVSAQMMDSFGGWVRNSIIRNNSSSTGGGNGGAGIYCRRALVDRCIIKHNSTIASSADGGGVFMVYDTSILQNSLIVSNTTSDRGGGVSIQYGARMENTTVMYNQAEYGGGVVSSIRTNFFINSIIYNNTHTSGTGNSSNYYVNDELYGLSFSNCCVAPLTNGTGNIDTPPLLEGGGNYKLSDRSPCIDAGLNLTNVQHDLDGIPRPLDGKNDGTNTTDIGCYEFLNAESDSDGDSMPDSWEWTNGLNPTNAADAIVDTDGDTVTNKYEYIADTQPTNAASFFSITSISNQPIMTVSFLSSSSRRYTLEGLADLQNVNWTNVPGTPARLGVDGTDSMTDTNAATWKFYRLKVAIP